MDVDIIIGIVGAAVLALNLTIIVKILVDKFTK
jgi:hypothetical protein